MNMTASDLLEKLEMAGVTAMGAPNSPVVETCQMMGSQSCIDEQNFEVGLEEQQPEVASAPTMGFEPS